MAMNSIGTAEKLVLASVVVLLVAVSAWRLRPRPSGPGSRVRFSLRWLMAAVLVVGLLCGELVRWRALEARRRELLDQLHLQAQVTSSAISESRAEIVATRRLAGE